jgi:hypothetical protein
MLVEPVAVRDDASVQMRCMRAGLVGRASELCLADFADVAGTILALQDPADTAPEWGGVRADLLGQG